MTEEREKRDRTKEFLGGRKGVGRWGDNQGITMREGRGVKKTQDGRRETKGSVTGGRCGIDR